MKKMMKVFSFVLTLVMICSLVFVLADTNEVHAEGDTFTVTYDANGGQFADGSTANQVVYQTPKKAHTANISDDGVQHGTYASNLRDKQVVRMDGAQSLHVVITCQMADNNAYSLCYSW